MESTLGVNQVDIARGLLDDGARTLLKLFHLLDDDLELGIGPERDLRRRRLDHSGHIHERHRRTEAADRIRRGMVCPAKVVAAVLLFAITHAEFLCGCVDCSWLSTGPEESEVSDHRGGAETRSSFPRRWSTASGRRRDRTDGRCASTSRTVRVLAHPASARSSPREKRPPSIRTDTSARYGTTEPPQCLGASVCRLTAAGLRPAATTRVSPRLRASAVNHFHCRPRQLNRRTPGAPAPRSTQRRRRES